MYLSLLCLLVGLLTPTGASGSGIVGGKEVKPHSRPYMVSLQKNGFHVCGGLLIRKNFVLTSAHCKKNEPFEAVLGAHNVREEERTQQKIKVKQYYPHPSYSNFDYDVMLLKLETNANLTKYVKVIGLPRKDGNIPANIKCSVAGWGAKRKGGSSESVLQEITLTIQNNRRCKEIWQHHFFSKQMICSNPDGKGFCQGDSGGPLICNKKPQGIAAFMSDCDNAIYPNVYMKIPFFIPWIKEVIEEYD